MAEEDKNVAVEQMEDQNVNGDAEGEAATAESPPTASITKHALQRKWVMWYDSPSSSKKVDPANWHSNVKQIVAFETVEDFWSLFNNLMSPSKLQLQSNYHLFKEGVMPAWEDPQNANGGKWVIELQKPERELLNTIWLYTILAMIGEAFEDSDDICGAVISLRKARNRLCVWTKTASDSAKQMRIGAEFKKIMEVDASTKITFTAHTPATRGAFNKPLYEL